MMNCVKMIVVGFCLLPCIAWPSIYKCTISGQTVFRDIPCVAGKESVLHLKPDQPGQASTDSDASPVQHDPSMQNQKHDSDPDNTKGIADYVAQQELAHKKADLQYKIDKANQNKRQLISSEQLELFQLRLKKTNAANNLAGATYENSISNEMTAVTQNYDTLIRTDESQISDLERQLDALSK